MTTHTEYIQKQADFPHLYKAQGDILAKHSKEDRENLFENNLVASCDEKTMDNTFKVFDIMLKSKFRGQIDVDPEVAERACITDYHVMLRMKLVAAEANAEQHRSAWHGEQMAKLVARQLKDQEEKAKKEEADKVAKMKELRGETDTSLPPPILDDEQIAKLKREAEEAEMVTLAAHEMERRLEMLKKKEFEDKDAEYQNQIEVIQAQIADTQCKGRDR